MALKPLEVKTGNIATYAVTESRIAKNAVTTDKLDDDAVTEPKLKAGCVTTGKLKDKCVTGAKIADATISQDKLILPIVVPSPITRPISPPIETTELKDGAVTRPKLAVNAVETDNIKDLNVTGGKLASSAVTTPKLADGSVTPAKMSFTPAARPLTPPITEPEIDTYAVTYMKIAPNSVNDEKLSAGAVTTPKIGDAQITNDKLQDGTITPAKLAFTPAKIKTGQYTGTYYTDYAVTGIGFQPKVVFIYLREFYNGGPFVKTDQDGAFAGWFSWPGPNWGYSADIIKSLDADGFTVAANSPANGLQNYDYIALG